MWRIWRLGGRYGEVDGCGMNLAVLRQILALAAGGGMIDKVAGPSTCYPPVVLMQCASAARGCPAHANIQVDVQSVEYSPDQHSLDQQNYN